MLDHRSKSKTWKWNEACVESSFKSSWLSKFKVCKDWHTDPWRGKIHSALLSLTQVCWRFHGNSKAQLLCVSVSGFKVILARFELWLVHVYSETFSLRATGQKSFILCWKLLQRSVRSHSVQNLKHHIRCFWHLIISKAVSEDKQIIFTSLNKTLKEGL